MNIVSDDDIDDQVAAGEDNFPPHNNMRQHNVRFEEGPHLILDDSESSFNDDLYEYENNVSGESTEQSIVHPIDEDEYMNDIERQAEFSDTNSGDFDETIQGSDDSTDNIIDDKHVFSEESTKQDMIENDDGDEVLDSNYEEVQRPLLSNRPRRNTQSQQDYFASRFDKYAGMQSRYGLATQFLMKSTFVTEADNVVQENHEGSINF